MKAESGHFLDKFFNPESVAIVGASGDPSRLNYNLVANLVNLGFQGRIYPVHPKEKEILGLKVYPTITAIDEVPDIAVIGVSNKATGSVLKDCVDKGIKRVTVIAGGFSETGNEGKGAQEEMARFITESGARAVGPNALSPIDVPSRFCISFHPLPEIKRGTLSLIFQSGLYEPRFDWLLSDFNLKFNKLIDLGNKMDIHEGDALGYLVDDPGTRVIGIHTESIRDGREFLGLLRRASEQKKRVVVLKSGRTQVGARAAASHTGSLVQGNDLILDAALRQCGAIRAYDIDEFFDLVRALEVFGSLSLRDNRIFLASLPGGEAVVITDLCEQRGLRLAQVEEATREKLKRIRIPWKVSPNPWDLGVSLQFNDPFHLYRVIVDSVAQDPNVSALLMQLPPRANLLPREFFEAFLPALEAHKPVVLWFPGIEPGRYEILEWAEDKGILIFPSPEKAVRALLALYRLSCQG